MVISQTLVTLLPGLRVSTSQKNFNSIDAWFALAVFGIHVFTPSLLWSLQALFSSFLCFFQWKKYDIIVLEYGIDQPGDMEALVSIACPDMAVFTTLDKVHALNFAHKDEILFEKTRLLVAARDIVFYPSDGEYIVPYLTSMDAEKLSYSLQEDKAHEADIGYSDYTLSYMDGALTATCTLLQWREKIGEVYIPVLGKEQTAYASLAVAISLILARRLRQKLLYNLEKEEYLWGFTLPLSLQEWRATVFAGIADSVLIDSSYNAAPESMKIMIDTSILLRDQAFPKRELVLCLGDMRELGQYTEEEHRKLAQYLAHRTDRLFLVGESMQLYFLDELKKLWFSSHRVSRYRNSRLLGQAVAAYLAGITNETIVLFKGSQNTIFMEEAVKELLADSLDNKKLCRQSAWWIHKKEEFFSSI